MQYMAAYRLIFSNPKWFSVILIGCLCMFIPVVGIIVFTGYLFEVIEYLHRRREEEKIPMVQPAEDAIQTRRTPRSLDVGQGSYPAFNLNRLSDYLLRGVWPVLVNLVASLPMMFAVGALFFAGIVLIQIAETNNADGLVIGIIIAVMFLGYLAAMVLWSMAHVPLNLRAGLGRDFASAFSVSFCKDFVRRVGKELILGQLFLFAGSLVLSLIGVLACYVGVYPAMVVAIMASHYMSYELYELYLERGGRAIVPVR